MMRARITGLGSYVPDKVLGNADIEKMVETTDEWIVERTGIRERRMVGEGESTSSMGVVAARRALDDAGLGPEDMDLILVGTCTPDYVFPSTAALIGAELGLPRVGAMDIQAACSGFIYGLSMAKAYVESGQYKRVLLICSETMTSTVDWTDRKTCILFGDGATAAVLEGSGSGYLVENCSLGADGSQSGLLRIEAGGARCRVSDNASDHMIKMEGREVYKHAVRRMIQAAESCLSEASISISDISWMVPHQANLRIIEAVAKRVDFPSERVYSKSVERHGNTSAASVGIAFDELRCGEEIAEGERVLFIAFGAGFTWGGALVQKVRQ